MLVAVFQDVLPWLVLQLPGVSDKADAVACSDFGVSYEPGVYNQGERHKGQNGRRIDPAKSASRPDGLSLAFVRTVRKHLRRLGGVDVIHKGSVEMPYCCFDIVVRLRGAPARDVGGIVDRTNRRVKAGQDERGDWASLRLLCPRILPQFPGLRTPGHERSIRYYDWVYCSKLGPSPCWK